MKQKPHNGNHIYCPFCEEQVNRFRCVEADHAGVASKFHLKCARVIEALQSLTARIEALEPKAAEAKTP